MRIGTPSSAILKSADRSEDIYGNPTIIIFFIFQRYIVEGIKVSGIKM